MSKNFKAVDGNTAATHVAYAYSEVAAIYPITPSSTMGEMADEWSSQGKKNIFGQTVEVVEMQSEGGAAGAVHGSLSAGCLTTTFTASQGLMLMLPNMYKIAGELLPTVFHVSARSLACQSLSIFGDHSDVMAARNTGFALMASGSVQEIMDLATVSHLASLKSRVPFLHFFDGFRTSSEVQKIELIPYETLAELFEPQYLEAFRQRALNPEKPMMKVGAENPDVYFQGRETVNKYYEATPAIVQEYMDKVAKVTGRQYHLFDYFGSPQADRVIIMMGSGGETAEETINYLNKQGYNVGLVKVRLFRPFDSAALRSVIPASVKKIAVLDRTKEPGAPGEPLFLDVVSALVGRDIKIIGGRYGLSSKEFTPAMVKAVYDHLDGAAFHGFTVGIEDDVSGKSLTVGPILETEPEGTVRCKFWGYGSDGTVGANKNSITIIGDNTDLYAQGYFEYDSKKSGGVTISHLRFGQHPIKSEYLVNIADFIALHKPAYIGRYDVLEGIRPGGVFLLNSSWKKEEVFEHLTEDMQRTIIDKKIKVYNIDAFKIAQEVGLKTRINTIMQVCFFKISGVLPEAEAIDLIKKAIYKSYHKKGDDIVKMNMAAVDRALEALEEVPIPDKITKSAPVPKLIPDEADDFAKKVIEPIMHFKGNSIPVSSMPDDGRIPTNTAKLEKRGVAELVPRWLPENCIQCNQCSFVCPHAAIRPKQILPADLEKAPAKFTTLVSNSKNDKNLRYRLQVYIEDCVGCGVCVETCPTKNKSLVMVPLEEERAAGENENVDFFEKLPDSWLDGNKIETIKGSQLLTPLFEFSGACAGCGETPYIKLATQLFGDRMIIANATGCSSIYGGTFPVSPYAKNKEGKGPTWANSLFEDNAEYGFGMRLAVDTIRRQLLANMNAAITAGTQPELMDAFQKMKELWNDRGDQAKMTAERIRKLLPAALARKDAAYPYLTKVAEFQDYFVDKSIWCIGGDGWAYDIGYGGLDHVIAMNRNVNLLVLDTEVYSNTGGQASKSTPTGSRAKFASSGKKTGKKDLGRMAMSYGYVYVASVAMGANMNQCLKAFMEAEAYDGPSLIIAYSPCINHGIDMSKSQQEEKLAVDTGYWILYRYNPQLAKEGKNPLILDSKEPKLDYETFLKNEIRYRSVLQDYPEIATQLFAQAKEEARNRFEYYKKLAEH
ncbi:MAG TPA: pyruvate:ferredoxin (flavodoxin) oxidoreductase [Candidatus Saccharicenans sp.]|nr:pyruvate:ferredoxin (flavodoxin) oxidoreductase [Candidatus Saccharicenans sp.]HQE64480.1 pyruvate:ferredoxin (flavodoxin) oxidoreductase [Candidatus Saccharicenans sp.]HQH60259.1 pyruvate:ferredoxin (flavodoxin) oxidoreductase [Candidatus Saccharicenans sp.]HQI21650.1 pyruvate:ferredoxin (flavodoxin) oxidoreductase [Candidatus Saccharicenans sp.]HRT24926.1 pyruvate:ferredoxin (flavodoxin) oxidoreductase [Candidatus Saccharicenans sp.]